MALVVGVVPLAGCGEDNGGDGGGSSSSEGSGPGIVTLAQIALEPTTVSVSGATPVGEDAIYSVTIRSASSDSALEVTGVWMEYAPVTPDELEPAFRLVALRACRLPGCPDPTTYDAEALDLRSLESAVGSVLVVDGSGEVSGSYTFLQADIAFKRPATAADRVALLKVSSNADGQPVAEASLNATLGKARIEVAPLLVDFNIVKAGESLSRVVGISNSGSDDLVIDRMEFQGSDYFKLMVGETEHAPGGMVTFDPPLVVAVNSFDTFDVSFTPLDGQPSTGTIRIHSNDPLAPTNGVLVELRGNTSGPCIQLNPSQTLSFGAKPIGNLSSLPVQVINCGNASLEIYDIRMKEGSSPDFGLDFSQLPEIDPVSGPTDDLPLVVDINQQVDLLVTFVPTDENPTDPDGVVIPDLGYIEFRNNTFDQFRELEVRGVGVDLICPEAVIFVQEGEEVIPQTTLHLFGDQSKAVVGQIAEWTWSVEQPPGSAQVFLPSDKVATPTFQANVAGVYRFSLDVVDDSGNMSCKPDEWDVAVIPDEAVHVELTWETPNDPDPTDEGSGNGADLDLHFAHPFAHGPDVDLDGEADAWFDAIFDCFWYNKNPDWEVIGEVADDPSLDRDDTDGAGPENLNLNSPADGRSYRIAVHYWNDHGFGPSLATVRLYLYSLEVWQEESVLLNEHDLWDVATLDWPSGEVTPLIEGGEFRIIPDYINPFFFQP